MYQNILDFWFRDLEPKMWWEKSSALDSQIKNKFSELHCKAIKGELFEWRKTEKGSLAEIILLDQFSRNIYRNKPQSFEYDVLALTLAQVAIEKGFSKKLSPLENSFLYLPFMHSESLLIHEEAIKLYTELGRPINLDFELKHKVIIERFGRYPHRNQILGRVSTEEEIEFLDQPNSSF